MWEWALNCNQPRWNEDFFLILHLHCKNLCVSIKLNIHTQERRAKNDWNLICAATINHTYYFFWVVKVSPSNFTLVFVKRILRNFIRDEMRMDVEGKKTITQVSRVWSRKRVCGNRKRKPFVLAFKNVQTQLKEKWNIWIARESSTYSLIKYYILL
jgi:hypothetical protein